MDNNDNLFDIFRSRSHQEMLTLAEDFEDRVFARIKKKKAMRRNIAVATVGFSLAGFLFLAQALVFHKEPEKTVMVQQESGPSVKEEIPIIEDVVFASSDSRASYAIEQVVYYEDDDTI